MSTPFAERTARQALTAARVGRMMNGPRHGQPFAAVTAISVAVLAACALLKELNAREDSPRRP